ncbi:MAG: hypothetical protein KGH94_00940 [Candidatus Micrarchaeota archaeon]|nr:hypothetical protein [Candidatus Micrarchaeota archaeon]
MEATILASKSEKISAGLNGHAKETFMSLFKDWSERLPSAAEKLVLLESTPRTLPGSDRTLSAVFTVLKNAQTTSEAENALRRLSEPDGRNFLRSLDDRMWEGPKLVDWIPKYNFEQKVELISDFTKLGPESAGQRHDLLRKVSSGDVWLPPEYD